MGGGGTSPQNEYHNMVRYVKILVSSRCKENSPGCRCYIGENNSSGCESFSCECKDNNSGVRGVIAWDVESIVGIRCKDLCSYKYTAKR